MSFSTALQRQSHGWIFFQSTLAILLIGIIDSITGYQVSFSLFYGVPIFIVAWYCDKKLGFLTALLAGITWWWADAKAGHLYIHTWLEVWEAFVRLGFFVFVSIGSSALKAQRDITAARITLLEHTQRLEHEIIGISEREQRRIGQDLHDGLCQYLAAVGCAAASLKSDLQALKLSQEAEVADELTLLLRDAVVQTRNLARGLVPVQMVEAGLACALEDLALSVARLLGIQCSFESSGSAIVHEESVAGHLYRIAQEAINNATKHGGASQIDISLTVTGGITTLRIGDNGAGISNTATDHSGMGLNIMKYRARLSGGELRIEEPPEGGTVVACIVWPRAQELHARAA
jgi:signal transduction histidine kinase